MLNFLADLYAPFYTLSVASLVGWMLFQKDAKGARNFQRLLLISLGTYLVSVISADAAFDYKMGTLFRDLMVMGAIGFLFRILMFKKEVLIAGGILLSLGYLWFYKTQIKPTFHENQTKIEASASAYSLADNGELLMEIKEDAQLAALQTILTKYDLQVERAFYPADAAQTNLDNYYVVDIPNNKTRHIQAIEKALYASGIVAWVEENEVITIAPMPAKKLPPINNKFGINDPGLEQMWGFEAMNIDKLYSYLDDNKIQPKRKALIAILDTGVDVKHEDLSDNFKSVNSRHNTDPVGHGTHCAGIAGAVSNNGKGVASYSTDNRFVEITSIRVLNSYGAGTQRGIINGIIEAADKGADVLSMSLGGASDRFKQKAYTDAVKYAAKKGGIVVAAAGNSNKNSKDYAPVNTPGVIGASAIDQDLNKASFSNTVQDIKMGVAAPGVNIYSTIPNGKYGAYNGTSMATPYVAGLLGLLKSIKPDLTAEQAYAILNKTGKDTKATNLTGKLIQPVDAVRDLVGNNN